MPNPLSDVQIANFALARIGSTQLITSFTDGSNEAAQCSAFYGASRDAVLRDFPWTWAQTYLALAQVSAAGARANAQWLYSYRYPSDCLYVRRLMATPSSPGSLPPQTTIPQALTAPGPASALRADGDPYPWPFEIGNDASGRLIFTDLPYATAVYTKAVTDPTQFPQDFASLIAWRLAVELAYGLAISDSRRKTAEERYEYELTKCRAVALNEGQSDAPWMSYQSEIVRARFGR